MISESSGRTHPNKDFIVIQCSTISPIESHHVARLYANKSINVITAPIIGGISAAERGELILIAAGSKKYTIGPSHCSMTLANRFFMSGQIIVPQVRSNLQSILILH